MVENRMGEDERENTKGLTRIRRWEGREEREVRLIPKQQLLYF